MKKVRSGPSVLYHITAPQCSAQVCYRSWSGCTDGKVIEGSWRREKEVERPVEDVMKLIYRRRKKELILKKKLSKNLVPLKSRLI